MTGFVVQGHKYKLLHYFLITGAKFPSFHLVAVDSLGVPVVAGGHLVQVGQTFPLEELSQNPSWPLVEEIQERAAAVLVEKGVDVPLLLVVMFETVVVLLSWKETAVSAWAFGLKITVDWYKMGPLKVNSLQNQYKMASNLPYPPMFMALIWLVSCWVGGGACAILWKALWGGCP